MQPQLQETPWFGRALLFVMSCAALAIILLAANTSMAAAAIDGQVCAPVRVMPLGDSITDGFPTRNGYRATLYNALTNAGYAVDFVGTQYKGNFADPDHEGHNGWRADQIRDNVYGWLTTNPARVVLLHIGTNDISLGNQSAVEVWQILEEIDRFEADTGRQVTVLLARIILRNDGLNPQTITYNDNVEAMATWRIARGDDIILVDQQNALIYPDDLIDTLHPRASGYDKMAYAWLEAAAGALATTGGACGE